MSQYQRRTWRDQTPGDATDASNFNSWEGRIETAVNSKLDLANGGAVQVYNNGWPSRIAGAGVVTWILPVGATLSQPPTMAIGDLLIDLNESEVGTVGGSDSGGVVSPAGVLQPTGIDDTAAIQALIDAGKPVILDKGTFYGAGIVWKNNVHLFGRGPEATILKLKDGANTDLIVGQNFASLTGGDTNGGIHDWSLNNVTLDGNLANNTAGWCLRVYAFSYTLNNVVMRSGYSGNLLSEWGNVNTLPVGASNFGEAYLTNVKSHSSRGTGIDWRGPHDSAWVNVITYENGNGNRFAVDGIKVSGAGGGPLEMSQVHSWGANQRYALNVAASSVHCTGCTFEGATGGAQVKLDAHKFRMVGGEIYRNSNSRTTTTTTFTIASSTTLTLTDATAWGTFGGVYFPATGVQLAYTGKSGNQLTGVTVVRAMGQTSIASGATVSSAGVGVLIGDGTTKNYTQQKIDTQIAAVEDAVVLWGAADGGQSEFKVLPFNVQRVYPTSAQNTAVTTGFHATSRWDAGQGMAQPRSERAVTANTTVTQADAISRNILHSTSSTDVTITLPAGIPQEVPIPWRQFGTGKMNFIAGTGMAVLGLTGSTTSAGQYAEGWVTCVNPTTWVVSGAVGIPGSVTPSGGGGGGGSSAYPSRLSVNATTGKIVDEAGAVVPKMKGFNMHVVPWSAQTFLDIAAAGAKFLRITIHWDSFEPTQGNIDPASISALDTTIARAVAAQLYVELELHTNLGSPGRMPSWTSAQTTDLTKYATYGQYITQFLAYRYGNPASPQYTKAVMGFGLNEPPLEDDAIRNSATWPAYMETKQQQMITWMRATGYAPDWIGFVAYGYAMASPLAGDGGATSTVRTDLVSASATAYNSVGGNVILDVHDYVIRDTRGTVPYDGRQYNGMLYPQYQGGTSVGIGDQAAYVSSTLIRNQQLAYMKPYKDFAASAKIPLMVGEWSWVPVVGGVAASGETDYITDKMDEWADAGAQIECHWNYDVTTNTSVNPYAARPGGTWRPSVLAWLTGTTGGGGGGTGGGTTFAQDSLTGTLNTAITAHTGEIGATWTTVTDRTGLKLDGNGLVFADRPGGAMDDSAAVASGAPTTADYDVSADVKVVTASWIAGVIGRAQTAAKTYYVAYYDAAGTFYLRKWVAGTETALGNYASTVATGATAALMLRMRGNTISLFVNGVQRISVTDAEITGAGKAGLWAYGTVTSTTGVHLDNFAAVNA